MKISHPQYFTVLRGLKGLTKMKVITTLPEVSSLNYLSTLSCVTIAKEKQYSEETYY